MMAISERLFPGIKVREVLGICLCIVVFLLAREGIASPAGSKNLLANGSFEVLLQGIIGDYPRYWTDERWTAEDSLEVVSDADGAHWGRRYLRLSAPGDAEIRVHSAFGKPIELQPGSSYTLRAWARKEPGAGEATLFLEPGKGKAELTGEWKEYTCTYSHPSDAKPVDGGMYIGILGGPAAVDDVSVVLGDEEPEIAVELKAKRSGIKALQVSRDWRRVSGEPVWDERAEIAVSEVMGVGVREGLVDIEIQDIFPGRFTYRDITEKRLSVVDATAVAGGKEVPWTLVNTRTEGYLPKNEQIAKAKGRFSIVFIASLPAKSTKTYYVYLSGEREGEEEVEYAEEVPKELESSASSHQLEWWRAGEEKRVDVTCKEGGGIVSARVRSWTARGASAELVSPDGRDKIPLPLATMSPGSSLWLSPSRYRLPEGSQEGIWKLAVRLEDSSGLMEEASTGFVHGSALWWDSNVERIFRHDEARYGRGRRIELYAARNESESFQVAIDTSEYLRDVSLSVTDAVHEKGTIGAEHFKVERIHEVYLSSPPRGRAGWYPDALLPWRKCDIGAGMRKLAWITVSVPKDAEAGVYWGTVVASCAGKKLELPLKLTVFDFELPDHPSLTVVMGADVFVGRQGRDRTKWLGGDETRYRTLGAWPYYIWHEPKVDYTAVLTLARMLAERRMSLHSYKYGWSGAYAAPWRYNPSDKTARFDFTMFDHNLKILLDELGANCVTLIAENRTGAGSPGWTGDGGPWMETRSSTYRNENIALATDLDQAWARGMAEHLKEKGWIDRAYVYVTDEPQSSNLGATARYCRILKEAAPELKTFGAGYGHLGWNDYHQYLDAFASAYTLSEVNRKGFAERGIENWSTYNRVGPADYPLAKARVIGLHLWDKGCPGFFEHNCTGGLEQDWTLNPKDFFYYPPTPAYPAATFIQEANPLHFGIVYPWPEDEPLPEKQAGPADSELIMPVSKGPGDVRFVPARQDRPFAPSLRLEALRESIDDFEYFEILKKAVEGAPAGSPMKKNYGALRRRLKILLRESDMRDHTVNTQDKSIFVIDTEELQGLRRDIGKAVEIALKKRRLIP